LDHKRADRMPENRSANIIRRHGHRVVPPIFIKGRARGAPSHPLMGHGIKRATDLTQI
jgi:hypothetical protein